MTFYAIGVLRVSIQTVKIGMGLGKVKGSFYFTNNVWCTVSFLIVSIYYVSTITFQKCMQLTNIKSVVHYWQQMKKLACVQN